MPTTVELCENGRILHYVFSEPWTIKDMEDAAKKATAYYDAASKKIHVFFDARGIRSVPAGILRARSNPDLRHPKSGYIAVVGASHVLQIMGETVLRLTHFSRAKFFQNEEEAWSFLRQMIAEEEQGTLESQGLSRQLMK